MKLSQEQQQELFNRLFKDPELLNEPNNRRLSDKVVISTEFYNRKNVWMEVYKNPSNLLVMREHWLKTGYGDIEIKEQIEQYKLFDSIKEMIFDNNNS